MRLRDRVRGAFQLLFRPDKLAPVTNYFKMLNGYTPIFSTYDGGVYEMELCRACIGAFAGHVSKLQPFVAGADLQGIRRVLQDRPNPFHTTPQFLAKAATIYDAQNTVYIVPILSRQDTVIGYYPVDPQLVELVDVNGTPFMRYTFASGEKASIELSRVGMVAKHLYHSDIRGEDNTALQPTMQLLATQNQGIAESIKNSASFRFMATYSDFADDDDLKATRKDFVDKNFGPDSGGLALFPNTFTNVQQIQSAAKIVDPEQVEAIEKRVFEYFGCNEKILMNQCVGDEWAAYYEGKIEPFALQLAAAMTCMTYSEMERQRGNRIEWSSNRLQYMSNAEKLKLTDLFDRGIFTTNNLMDVWNLPHVPDGDKRYIRREYVEVSRLGEDDVTMVPASEPEKGETNADT